MLLDYYSMLYITIPGGPASGHRYFRLIMNNGGAYEYRFNVAEFSFSRHLTVDENYLSVGGFTTTQPNDFDASSMSYLSDGTSAAWTSCSRTGLGQAITLQWDYGATAANWPSFQSARIDPGNTYEVHYTPNYLQADYSDDGVTWTNLFVATGGLQDGASHTFYFPQATSDDLIVATYFKMYFPQVPRFARP